MANDLSAIQLDEMNKKLDQLIRVLERLEDRVSAIETGMLHDMGAGTSR